MMQIIKGSTGKLTHTFYSYWSGQESSSIRANLAGATITTYFKARSSDPDTAILLTKSGTVTDAVNGLAETALAASDTNALSYTKMVRETIAKLADGVTYIREVEEFELLANVKKTLP